MTDDEISEELSVARRAMSDRRTTGKQWDALISELGFLYMRPDLTPAQVSRVAVTLKEAGTRRAYLTAFRPDWFKD